MGLYSGGLNIGRILESEIWGAYFREGFFFFNFLFIYLFYFFFIYLLIYFLFLFFVGGGGGGGRLIIGILRYVPFHSTLKNIWPISDNTIFHVYEMS